MGTTKKRPRAKSKRNPKGVAADGTSVRVERKDEETVEPKRAPGTAVQQALIPPTEKDERIDDLARRLHDARTQRLAWAKVEQDASDELISALHSRGMKQYAAGGIEIELVIEKEKVRVRVAAGAIDDEPAKSKTKKSKTKSKPKTGTAKAKENLN